MKKNSQTYTLGKKLTIILIQYYIVQRPDFKNQLKCRTLENLKKMHEIKQMEIQILLLAEKISILQHNQKVCIQIRTDFFFREHIYQNMHF